MFIDIFTISETSFLWIERDTEMRRFRLCYYNLHCGFNKNIVIDLGTRFGTV